jgi:hypothetical protein
MSFLWQVPDTIPPLPASDPFERFYVPFIYDIRHEPLSVFEFIQRCGVWGIILLGLTATLMVWAIYLACVGCRRGTLGLYFAFVGLLPAIGLHGTLYSLQMAAMLIGPGSVPDDQIVALIYETSMIAQLAGLCFLLSSALGIAVVTRNFLTRPPADQAPTLGNLSTQSFS